MENGICSAENKNLPVRILVASNYSKSATLDVTILAAAPGLRIHHLTNTSIANKRLIFLDPENVNLLRNSISFYVKEELYSGHPKYGYLIRCSLLPNAFQIIEAPIKPPAEIFEGIDEVTDIAATFEANIDSWKSNLNPTEVNTVPHFSMKPPTAANRFPSPTKNIYALSPQSETDPENFLSSRYFSTLYSFTTPLSYFPKTALSRFRNLCNNDPITKKKNLLSMYFTIEQLEARQSNKYGLDPTQDPLAVSKYEQRYRDLFISNNSVNLSKEESLRQFVFELKIREAQLQILLLMELLLCWGKDETTFLKENANIQEKRAKKSLKLTLVRPKKGKKRIVPTFLGIGIQDSPEKTEPTASPVESMLYISLITLVDQMSIWDTLSGRVKGNKDDSMYGFLVYVLVPYFKAHLPETVNFIIQKVKELRPKLHVSKSRSKAARSKSTGQLPDSVLGDEDQSDVIEKTESTKRTKFSKTLLSSGQVPFLHRASTDLALNENSGDLQPAFLLKRSKSNLASRNLKRRQVDMSLLKSESQDAEEVKKGRSFLFGDARKSKSVQSEYDKEVTVRQVEATPAKINTALRSETFSQVMETPTANRTKHLALVSGSPLISYGKRAETQLSKHAMNGMFASLAPPEDLSLNITSSPVRLAEVTNIPKELTIESSPSRPALTSKIKSKTSRKLKSPFIDTSNGSPSRKRRYMKGPSDQAVNNMASPVYRLFDSKKTVSQTHTLENDFQETDLTTQLDTVVDSIPESPSHVIKDPVMDSSPDDSGSDSDLEKLLAYSSRPRLKTYGKK